MKSIMYKEPIEITVDDMNEEEVSFLQADINYRNNVHRVLRYTLFPVSLVVLCAALGVGIAAWYFIQSYPRTIVDGYIGYFKMNSQEYLPLYATGVVLEFVVLMFSLFIFGLSYAAMRHEKRQTETYPRVEKLRLFFKRFLSSILTACLIVVLAFNIVFTIMVAYTLQKFWTITRYSCSVDALACKRIDQGYKLFSASSVMATVGIVALLMLNTAILSHTGSMKIKSSTMSTTTTTTSTSCA